MNEKIFDVVSLGESLIDVLIDSGKAETALNMTGNAGGAPLNVLAALSQLNRKTAFLGKLSKDMCGDFLKRIIIDNGIDTSGIVYSDKPTALAMVSLDERGNRAFSFHRGNTADVSYSADEINKGVISAAKIFHFGSVSMTADPCRQSTLEAARFAREIGVKVSFDPNLRPALWAPSDNPKEWIIKGLKLSDYVKLSEEELLYLTGSDDLLTAGQKLYDEYKLSFLSITLGEKGCIGFCNGFKRFENTYDTLCVDTTGAGDASWGAALSCICGYDCKLDDINEQRLYDIVRFSNAAGALCASKYGAIQAMPSETEIRLCMENMPLLKI